MLFPSFLNLSSNDIRNFLLFYEKKDCIHNAIYPNILLLNYNQADKNQNNEYQCPNF